MARRTKVMRIVTRLNVGGPTRHVAMLTADLPERGIDGVLVTGVTEPGESDGETPSGTAVVTVPTLRRGIHPWRDVRAFLDLRRLMRSERPDVVHTHQGKAGFLGRLAAWTSRVPRVVHTYHGFTFSGHFGAMGSVLSVVAEWIAVGWATDLVCQDPRQAAELSRRLGRRVAGKIRIVPPAADVGSHRVAPPSFPPRIVLPARLVHVKDPERALDVLAALPGPVVMDVLGDGPLRPSLERRVASDPHLRGRVTFHGNVVPPFDILAAASVVLLTSRSEGTPLSLIEAQMLGVPVVAPDVGGVAGVVVPGGGRVVEAGTDALTEAVAESLLRPRLPEEVVRAARDRFDRRRLAERIAAVYAGAEVDA